MRIFLLGGPKSSGSMQRGGARQTPPAEPGFLAEIHLILRLKVRNRSRLGEQQVCVWGVHPI